MRVVWPRDFEEYAIADLPRLMRIARVLAGDEHNAADLVQDCLARMGLRWGRGSGISNPHAYARASLVNLNVSRLRRFRRETLVRTVPDTSVPADRDEGLEPWLETALRRLPARQRAAIALAYLEDMSVADLARALGCSESAAKTHLSRGRAALQKAAEDASAQPITTRRSDGDR